ncbi:MAG: PQQ-binding-like beta-propeller repeat protein [Gemmatimonadales bacterium]
MPTNGVPGETPSPTQPFPTLPKPLHPLGATEADLFGLTPADLEACRTQFRGLSTGAFFAPPSLEGTLQYPGFGGGINWGGVAIDTVRGVMIVNHLRMPMWVRLAKRSDPNRGNQLGTPYTLDRGGFVAPSGMPCIKPPWGVITAIDVGTGQVKWERPLGWMPGLDSVPDAKQWGSITFGGPIVTAGGLVFIASTADERIRAFDVDTGEELWSDALPAGGIATPMTYEVGGRQYLLIAAGGHSRVGTRLGDHLIAYALPARP